MANSPIDFLLVDGDIRSAWAQLDKVVQQRIIELERYLPAHIKELRDQLAAAQKLVDTLPGRIEEAERRLDALSMVKVPERPFSEALGVPQEP